MEKDKLFKSLSMLAILASVLAIFACISLYKGWDAINNTASNSITVSGENKVMVSPDIATITFAIEETKSTSKEAQALVSAKMDKVKKALNDLKIDSKDIKTDSYSVSPKYTYQYCNGNYIPCTNKEKLEGYVVVQNITVKVRDIDNTGKALDALGLAGVNNISGPNFTVDNMDKIRADSRGKAIEDAKAKAKVLADQLGVDLEDIISYSDDNNSMIDIYRVALPMEAKTDGIGGEVSLPRGQNEVNVKVTLTYRIK